METFNRNRATSPNQKLEVKLHSSGRSPYWKSV